jgi:hypothetical protein
LLEDDSSAATAAHDGRKGGVASGKGRTIHRTPLSSGLVVEVALLDGLDFSTAAVGDRVKGVLRKDVSDKSAVVLPKGTVLKGRLLRFERQQPELYSISVKFSEYVLGGQRYPFQAQLQWTGRKLKRYTYAEPGGEFPTRAPPANLVSEEMTEWERTNNTFYSSPSKLPRGFRMTWLTVGAERKSLQ